MALTLDKLVELLLIAREARKLGARRLLLVGLYQMREIHLRPGEQTHRAEGIAAARAGRVDVREVLRDVAAHTTGRDRYLAGIGCPADEAFAVKHDLPDIFTLLEDSENGA